MTDDLSENFQVIERTIDGKTIRFCINDPEDWIQQYHFKGEFYEAEELSLFKKHVNRKTHYVDVGANIGNHILFVCKFIDPQSVLAFEPNPTALALLKNNLSENKLQHKVQYKTCGLSDQTGNASMLTPINNLGGSVFSDTANPSPYHQQTKNLKLCVGDKLLMGKEVNFIKIDVEGMELKVLRGLQHTISTWRPKIFIEIDNANLGDFFLWTKHSNYEICYRNRRYIFNENFLIIPKEK